MADPTDPSRKDRETHDEMERLVAEAYHLATTKAKLEHRRPRSGMTRQRRNRLLLGTLLMVGVWDAYSLTRPVAPLDTQESLENASFAVVSAALAVESFYNTHGRLPRNLDEVQMQEWDVRYWPRGEEYELEAETEEILILYRSGDNLLPLAVAAGVPGAGNR